MIDVNEKIKAKVEALPDSPGVYRWKDKDGRIIYVGKAKNLKNRVRSYVREDKNRSPKVAAMIRHADDLDITMTGTEMEALILECNLIKELHPKYNISLRDDKSYPEVRQPSVRGNTLSNLAYHHRSPPATVPVAFLLPSPQHRASPPKEIRPSAPVSPATPRHALGSGSSTP